MSYVPRLSPLARRAAAMRRIGDCRDQLELFKEMGR